MADAAAQPRDFGRRGTVEQADALFECCVRHGETLLRGPAPGQVLLIIRLPSTRPPWSGPGAWLDHEAPILFCCLCSAHGSGTRMTARAVAVVGMRSILCARGSRAGQNPIAPPHLSSPAYQLPCSPR